MKVLSSLLKLALVILISISTVVIYNKMTTSESDYTAYMQVHNGSCYSDNNENCISVMGKLVSDFHLYLVGPEDTKVKIHTNTERMKFLFDSHCLNNVVSINAHISHREELLHNISRMSIHNGKKCLPDDFTSINQLTIDELKSLVDEYLPHASYECTDSKNCTFKFASGTVIMK